MVRNITYFPPSKELNAEKEASYLSQVSRQQKTLVYKIALSSTT